MVIGALQHHGSNIADVAGVDEGDRSILNRGVNLALGAHGGSEVGQAVLQESVRAQDRPRHPGHGVFDRLLHVPVVAPDPGPGVVGRTERRHLHEVLHAHLLGGADDFDLEFAEARLVIGQQEEPGCTREGRLQQEQVAQVVTGRLGLRGCRGVRPVNQ